LIIGLYVPVKSSPGLGERKSLGKAIQKMRAATKEIATTFSLFLSSMMCSMNVISFSDIPMAHPVPSSKGSSDTVRRRAVRFRKYVIAERTWELYCLTSWT